MDIPVHLSHPKTPYQQDTLRQVMELVASLPLKPETVAAIKEDLKYDPPSSLLEQIRMIDATVNKKLGNTTPAPYIK